MNELFSMENINNESMISSIAYYVERVNNLNSQKDVDFKDTEIFGQATELLGDYPPIKLIEDILSYYKQKKQKLVTDDIPTAMQAAGYKKITLKNGTSVTLSKCVSVVTENKENLMKWLEEKGYHDDIKDTLEFGKGELDYVVQNFLNESGYTYKQTSGVHYKTLNRIMQERIEDGDVLPPEHIAKVKMMSIAKIKE